MGGDFGLWGGTVGPPISDRVWPPAGAGTPFLSFACLRPSLRPEPQPAAEPEQPVAPRTGVARPGSPATPPKWSALPPSSSRHSPLTVTACPLPFPPDSRLGPTSAPTSPWSSGYPSHVLPWPALPCPGVHQGGPPSGSADPALPPRPPLPTADPSQPLTCAWHGFAAAPMLL